MSKAGLKNEIRKLRFENDEMTQEELAGRVRCTRHTIMALEAGKYVPSLLLAYRISRVFKTSIETVFPCLDESV